MIALATVYCNTGLTTAAALSDGLYSIKCGACRHVYAGWAPLLRDGHVIQGGPAGDPSGTPRLPAQRT